MVEYKSGWISVDEALPSEDGEYLVSIEYFGMKHIEVLNYGKPTYPESDDKCFYVCDRDFGDVPDDDVMAWMPLPEPYGGEKNE